MSQWQAIGTGGWVGEDGGRRVFWLRTPDTAARLNRSNGTSAAPLLGFIKSHPSYETADGLDLGIEAVDQPSQSMKPTARLRTENGHVVRISVLKDGHDSVIVSSRRGSETQPVRLGVFSRAEIMDSRPNLVPNQPECREYTLQYVDDDAPVGEVSDVFRVVTSGLLAA